MEDRGGNLGANVEIVCINCGDHRNIREAMGKRGEENLPRCRGRHPHLATFDPQGCARDPKVLVVGASNQWFAQTLSALAVPQSGASALDAKVEKHWAAIEPIGPAMFHWARTNLPAFKRTGSPTSASTWCCATPPFGDRAWGYDELTSDPRWTYGLPPRGESELALGTARPVAPETGRPGRHPDAHGRR